MSSPVLNVIRQLADVVMRLTSHPAGQVVRSIEVYIIGTDRLTLHAHEFDVVGRHVT